MEMSFAALLIYCAVSFPWFAANSQVTKKPWWNGAVIYEIFPRSFQDSNGDGSGDLKGIIRRLDYLNSGQPDDPKSLGVDAIWLTPIFTSPSYHGYDAVDYKAINPDFGSMEDFKLLITEAHKRGIKVLLDLAVNHTSIQSPWFQSASQNSNSPFRNWYLWMDHDPKWRLIGRWWPLNSQEFYYSTFSKGLPDLNWKNPDVAKEIQGVFSFWSKLGVDGFRLDAARYYVEGPNGEPDTEGTHQVLRDFVQATKKSFPNTMFVGEVWANAKILSTYVNSGDELDLAFGFPVAFGLVSSLEQDTGNDFLSSLTETLARVPNQALISPFTTNHDMVRIASRVGGDLKKLKLAATVVLSLPGTPVLYYGEEIGLSNSLSASSPGDLAKRTPMQWDSSLNYGFSEAINGKLWQPLSTGSKALSVASQLGIQGSLLNYYQKMIRLRKREPALQWGDLRVLNSPDPRVVVYQRRLSHEAAIIVLNFGDAVVSKIAISLPASQVSPRNTRAEFLWGNGSATLANSVLEIQGVQPKQASIIKLF